MNGGKGVGRPPRITCQKFEHPTLCSELQNYVLNTEFVSAVGKLRKNKPPFES